MKTLHSLVPALCACSLLLLQPVFAFDNAPEETEPPLSMVFPLEQRGEQVVTNEDILINPACIIPSGSVFLTIFVPPPAGRCRCQKGQGREGIHGKCLFQDGFPAR